MQASPQATVMNFLNEVTSEFPAAIPLAAGRPTEKFFDRLDANALIASFDRYRQHVSAGDRARGVMARLLQYGRTAGLIGELVATQLQQDEQVTASSDRLLITTGCQEAIALCLSALCPDKSDVALVCNPTYIGATGAAHASSITLGVLEDDGKLSESLEYTVARLHRQGRRARVLYLIPDFDNPTGRVLDEAQRRALLAVAARHRIVILEDNPYGMFRYEGEVVPPMAKLDQVGCVVYLSTYSKTICPAVRVGSLTLPETLFGDRRARERLYDELTQRKSFLTVNTSQITQAMVGGLLLEHDGSLRQWIKPAVDLYRNNRDNMLLQLQLAFASFSDSIRWNRPSGGFFLSLDLPFRFDAAAVTKCANDYGVIVMPMAFFALDASQDHRIRLAFSAVDGEQIATGVANLARFVAKRMESVQGKLNQPETSAASL